jgi:hypothetical protein
MVKLDPAGSRGSHEEAIERHLVELDPQFGAILAPYLKFDQLDDLSDADRRRLRTEIASKVQILLEPEIEQK